MGEEEGFCFRWKTPEGNLMSPRGKHLNLIGINPYREQ